ncbi:MAG: UPF0175 family protein [Lachnospiraceae bacterium]|nr:UPF0175 family protein [Lachnospiraceae bacterium]
MVMKTVEIKIPESIEKYTVLYDNDDLQIRNAMLVYPYIKKEIISYGKAAELLGMSKIELIQLYGKLGFAYFDETSEELEEELELMKTYRGIE